MPANTVKVCRPTLWGNPHKVEGETSRVDAAFQYKADLESGELKDKEGVPLINRVQELEGKNLACWCPEGSCCHADFLLAHANPAEAKPGCAPVTASETVLVELTMRVLEYHTFEREVNKADFDHQRKHGDVTSWLDEQFKDDPMPDSDISTESFELDEWKLLKSPNAELSDPASTTQDSKRSL